MTTPWKPSTPSRCDGLTIQVGTPELSNDKASAMARRVVKETLKGKWWVKPLGRDSRMFELLAQGQIAQPRNEHRQRHHERHGAAGAVRSETLKAFTEEEYREIIAALPDPMP